MNEVYAQVREHLRQQHERNMQEAYGKQQNISYYYDNQSLGDVHDKKQRTSWTFSFPLKIALFIAAILTFSCYLYGGQDIKKGMYLAISETETALQHWEETEPAVAEAMGHIRSAYADIKDFAEEYILEMNQTEE